MRHATRSCFLLGALLVSCAGDARAGFLVQTSFNDPGSLYSTYYDRITEGVQAAANDWGSRIVGSGALKLQINFTDERTASARSAYVTRLNGGGDVTLWQQGALSTIKLVGTAGGGFDAILNIGVDYLVNTLWFDPDPTSRTAPIPAYMIDAQSVFLHEFGHILFMNGWRDWTTGLLPGNYQSTFDRFVTTDGSDFYFNGPRAVALYGGPVPLTAGNIMHLGNRAPRPGSDLILDVMNGVVTYYQQRYYISELDLAIAADTGVVLFTPGYIPPAYVPEPSALALLGIGMLVVGTRRMISRGAA